MTILQYCSVCKAEYEMAVVPTDDGEDDGVVWLQCPSCKGFLPKISSSPDLRPRAEAASDAVAEEPAGEAPPADDADAAAAPAPEPPPVAAAPLDDIDPERAVPYRPWQTYELGDVIHHLAWDDYGIVIGKETLPGNRRTVKVRFAGAGEVRLIEQEGEQP